MTAHSELRRVPYTPQQMFDLVSDVGSYPKFIPWISGSRVRKKTGDAETGVTFEADLVIAFAVFRESYTSLVKTFPAGDDDIARIDIEAISGPFNKLVCDMEFDVDFAFRNRLMQRAAGAAFDIAMRKIAGAFEDRAKELYGSQ